MITVLAALNVFELYVFCVTQVYVPLWSTIIELNTSWLVDDTSVPFGDNHLYVGVGFPSETQDNVTVLSPSHYICWFGFCVILGVPAWSEYKKRHVRLLFFTILVYLYLYAHGVGTTFSTNKRYDFYYIFSSEIWRFIS